VTILPDTVYHAKGNDLHNPHKRYATDWQLGERIRRKELTMAESVYKVIELIGSSTESWEKAASAAVERAAQSLQDLRVAEVVQLDMHLENGQVLAYRAKVKVSFKYHDKDEIE
jgi:dodecin